MMVLAFAASRAATFVFYDWFEAPRPTVSGDSVN